MTTNTPEGSGIVERLRTTVFAQPAEGQRLQLVAEEAADRILTLEARLAAVEAENGRLREALEPFATFARDNVDEEGWSGLEQHQSIDVWFGPSEFSRAAAVLGTPTNSDTGAS
jgi:hypothetical protein